MRALCGQIAVLSLVRSCVYRENRNRPHLRRCRFVPCHLGIYPAKSAYRYFDWCVEKMTPLFRKAVWLLFAVSVCAFLRFFGGTVCFGYGALRFVYQSAVMRFGNRIVYGNCPDVQTKKKWRAVCSVLSLSAFRPLRVFLLRYISCGCSRCRREPLASCGAPWTFRLKRLVFV